VQNWLIAILLLNGLAQPNSTMILAVNFTFFVQPVFCACFLFPLFLISDSSSILFWFYTQNQKVCMVSMEMLKTKQKVIENGFNRNIQVLPCCSIHLSNMATLHFLPLLMKTGVIGLHKMHA
jgi:hypothetical protein